MIVHHAYGLHEGVTDRRTDETESSFLKIPAHPIGLGCPGRNIPETHPTVLDGFMTDKLPEVPVEGPEFLPDPKKGLRVLHGGFDFQAVSNDPWILEQLFHVTRSIP